MEDEPEILFTDRRPITPNNMNATTSNHEERLKAAVHLVTGDICEKEFEEAHGVSFSKEAIATLTEIAFQICRGWGKDLGFFAKHAGRSTTNAEDVFLLVRRNPKMLEYMKRYSDGLSAKKEERSENAALRAEAKKNYRLSKDGEKGSVKEEPLDDYMEEPPIIENGNDQVLDASPITQRNALENPFQNTPSSSKWNANSVEKPGFHETSGNVSSSSPITSLASKRKSNTFVKSRHEAHGMVSSTSTPKITSSKLKSNVSPSNKSYEMKGLSTALSDLLDDDEELSPKVVKKKKRRSS